MKYCFLFLLSVGFGYSVFQTIDYYSMEDLYIDRLVYSKKDSTLFSGTLKVSDYGSTYKISFINGLPNGAYEEVLNEGDYVTKGEYIDPKSIFKQNTLKLLSNDTILLDYWSEGGLESDPMHLNLYILKSNHFFNKQDKNNAFINILLQSVVRDTKKMKYKYLKICFVDSVFEWKRKVSFNYIKTEKGIIEDN